MGWNDRLLEDPFVPSSDHYQERDNYEAWLEYMTAQAMQSEQLMSQNIDPAQLAKKPPQETPARKNILTRLWANIFGHQKQKSNQDYQAGDQNAEEPVVPF